MTLPPGPNSLLFGLDNVSKFSNDILGFSLKQKQEFGDCVSFRMGPFRGFFFFHPDQIKEILLTHWQKLPKMERNVRVLRQWDGNGLLLSEGKFWQRQHRLVKPAFSPNTLASYCDIFVNRTKAKISKWDKVIDMDEQMTSLTLEIICESIFGGEVREQTKELGKAVHILNDVAMKEMPSLFIPPRWLPTEHNRKKFWAMELLDQTIKSFIEQKSKNPTNDLLSSLLSSADEEGKMTLEQVRDEAMVLFLAGHDTTAASLIWTFYLLSKNSEVEKKVIAEINEVLGQRSASFADIPKLKYLRQVILESLRLYPPAIGTFAREASEDLIIGGYEVPKKSIIWNFSFITQRDERWFPNPLLFDPDRFSPEREKLIPQFAYFPFGGGPRACIGKDFAITEMILVIATILQKCRPKLQMDGDASLRVGFSLRPAEKLMFSI